MLIQPHCCLGRADRERWPYLVPSAAAQRWFSYHGRSGPSGGSLTPVDYGSSGASTIIVDGSIITSQLGANILSGLENFDVNSGNENIGPIPYYPGSTNSWTFFEGLLQSAGLSENAVNDIVGTLGNLAFQNGGGYISSGSPGSQILPWFQKLTP